MKRQTLLKSTLCLLMALVCHVAWAQTSSWFKMGASTTSLSDGDYVLVAKSDKGTGPVFYDPSVGKPYRYDVSKTVAEGHAVQSKYVWTIDETTLDGVQHITVTNHDDNTKAFPVDGASNLNFTGSGTASLKTEIYTADDGVDYIVLTLDNEAIGYVHANAPGGNPCLSYWPTNGDGASCIKFTFFPVNALTNEERLTYNVGDGKYNDRAGSSSDWRNGWTSTNVGKPSFTISVGANNVNAGSAEYIGLRPGSGGCTYTLTLGETFTGYSFEAKSNNATPAHVVTINGKETTISSTEWTTVRADVVGTTASFGLKGSNDQDLYIRNVKFEQNAEVFAAVTANANMDIYGLQRYLGLVQNAGTGLEGNGQLICNYPAPTSKESGNAYANLLDGTYTTFFHSGYENYRGDGSSHYLQANLGKAVKSFRFYFKKRSQNDNNRPKEILIEGSVDGNTFEEIETISDGMPSGAAPTDYYSDEITASKAYKYLRFTVKKTHNDESSGNPFFTFSEFYILPNTPKVAETFDAVRGFRAGVTVENATKLNQVFAWNDMLTKGEPVVGKESYIYADTYKDGAFLNRYLYSNNGTLTLNTALQLHTDNYIWTPAKNGEKYNFANKAGRYLAHKGMSDSEHNFTVAPTTSHLGVTLHTQGSNYFVIHNADGQFNQASGTYDQTTQAYCTDFVFVPTDLYEGVYALTIDGDVDGTATFNGETKALPATFYVTEEIDEENAMVTVAINDKTWRLTNITDASSNVVENLKITSLSQNATYTVNVEPNIAHGGLYYIYNDNDTRQYFYNDGGTLKVSENRTDWDNAYLFTCIKSGNYVQFKNAKGKYLKHQGLQDAAYNFELKEYTYNGDKRVALYSVSASKYFVMKNDGSFSQANDPFHAEAGDYSTSFKFEEVAFYPKDGETYYIYSDTYQEGKYVNRYLYADGSNLKLNTFVANSDEYKWTCTVDAEGKVQFQNGKGKYLKHRGLQDAAYKFTIGRENAKHNIAATLYSITDGRYFVVKNDGSGFDQSTGTYNQTTDAYCTDFVFLPVNEVNLLSINGDSKVKATATWNDETRKIPAAWVIHEDLQSATSGTLTINAYTHTLSSFKEGETVINGNQVNIDNIVTDRSFTTTFTPAFFSTTYGEKWVNIVRATNASHAAILGNSTENTIPTYNTLDYSDEGTLWCFVGTADNFKIYNKKSTDLALTQGGTPANEVTVKMTAAGSAISWYLKEYADGYAIAPVGNTGFGMNSYGGVAGNQIKFYGIGDAGSHWNFNVVDINKTLTFGIEVDNVWKSSPRVAELAFTVNGVKTTTRVLNSVDEKIYYLPVGSTFSISSENYRGYTFNGFGNGVESYENQTIPEGGLDITASYTANDERTLFYSPSATGHPYRIPAIATAPNGDIFAICDHRPCGSDIGYGEVDIVCRISTDNGATWGEELTLADGDGGSTNRMETGYGDPAIVADRESNKILVMMVAGRTVCHNGRWSSEKKGDPNASAVNRVARVYGTLNETTGEWEWTAPVEMTDHMYSIFMDGDNATVPSMFIGSGKICQSRVVKKGDYYRLYCALWTNNGGNRVIYSDDFGASWNVLGTLADRPASGGDEPKCEELPDGSVILSSRVSGGRWFNIFTFNKDGEYTTGTWGQAVKSTTAYDGSGNGTNGEIYKVKVIRKEDGKICDVMLQSIPAGPGRTNVKVYYKEMEYNADGTNKYTPADFAADWKVGKHVSNTDACYSTMHLQADGRIGFFFEEVPGGYCMVYIPYKLEDLTDNKYSLYTVNSTIGQYGVGTFYASEAVQIPEGLKAYVATEEPVMENGAGVITMTELEGIIPAHTGAVLRGDAATYKFIPSISYGVAVKDNMLVGFEGNNMDADLYREEALVEGYTTYVLTVVNEKAGFYKKEDGFKVYNNKAYLNVPESKGQARALYFNFDNDATGIVETENESEKTEIYDLAGRRVQKVQKGLYIVNGKKVLK